MVFNPLFLQVVNNQETQLLNKTQKLTGPSYLFSDIIKVHLDKNETGGLPKGMLTPADNNLLSSLVSAISGQSAASALTQMQNAGGIPATSAIEIKTFNQPLLPGQQDKNVTGDDNTISAGDINSLLVGNTELLNFIKDLLANHQLDGKISIVNTGTEGSDNGNSAINPTNALPVENLSAGEVLNLLKNGNTIAVENSGFQSSNGLLITLVEFADNAETQSGIAQINPFGANNTLTATNNIPPAQTLAGIGDGNAQSSEQLYKLKFSLVNNPGISEPVTAAQEPIVKLPFANLPGDINSSVKNAAEGTAVNNNLTADVVSVDKKNQTPGSLVVPGADTKTAADEFKETAYKEITVQDSPAEENNEIGNTPKEIRSSDNVIKESEVKAGKFINIERIKTDSGIQIKGSETQEPQKQPGQETPKMDLPVSELLHTEQKKNQKADAGTDKKAAENQSPKLQELSAPNQKEKELKISSPQDKQDASVSAENKTDAKNSEKNEMNSSSKEQNRQSPESILSNDHTETKGKTQEDHSFNIGSQTKVNDNAFTVKRTMDSGLFGEAAKTVKAAEVMKEISKFIQQGDKSSIVLKIDPENLGTVKIALNLADKVVHANIEVENEAARKLMENNLNQLYNSLNQSGIQFNSINISLANSEHKQGKMPNQKRRASTDGGDKDTDDIDALREKQMGYNTYDYLI